MTFLDAKHGDRLTLPSLDGRPETVHVFDGESIDAINAALAAGRPLLVRGEPGTGKSQLARAAAEKLERAFHSSVIDARTEPRDLLWAFDAVTRLAEAQVAGVLKPESEEAVRDTLHPEKFLAPGPLWWAFHWDEAAKQAKLAKVDQPTPPDGWTADRGVVLLIDEIDKADASVPNGLLEALGLARFVCPGGKVVSRKETHENKPIPWPLIVITTNEERTLPDAFLRRCLVLHLGWSDDEATLIEELTARGAAHFEGCDERVLRRAAEQLAADRAAADKRRLTPPGGAEYLDLLRAVTTLDGEASVAQRLRAAQAEELIGSSFDLDDPVDRQLGLLELIGRFALQKHSQDPRW